MFTGHIDTAAEPPAGGRGNDIERTLPTEELWAQLHPENEDRSAGKAHVTIEGADGENAVHVSVSVLIESISLVRAKKINKTN